MTDQLLLSLFVRRPSFPGFAIKLFRRHSDESFYIHCAGAGPAHAFYETDSEFLSDQLPRGGDFLYVDGIGWAREVETSAALAIHDLVYSTPITLIPDPKPFPSWVGHDGTGYYLTVKYSPGTFATLASIEFTWFSVAPEGWSHFGEVAERMIEWAEPEAVLNPIMEGDRKLPEFIPEVLE